MDAFLPLIILPLSLTQTVALHGAVVFPKNNLFLGSDFVQVITELQRAHLSRQVQGHAILASVASLAVEYE